MLINEITAFTYFKFSIDYFLSVIDYFRSLFSTFTNHRRAISNLPNIDAMSPMLPQLTSPLSPPAFNPHDILLGSNEAIAGLDSPASVPASVSVSAANNLAATSCTDLGNNASPKLSENAFNWLDSKMNDLRIGKRSMNALALEKQQQTRQTVSRNATVFQFPDTTMPSRSVNAFNPPLTSNQHSIKEVKQLEHVEPVYAKVVKPARNYETKPATNEQKSNSNDATQTQQMKSWPMQSAESMYQRPPVQQSVNPMVSQVQPTLQNSQKQLQQQQLQQQQLQQQQLQQQQQQQQQQKQQQQQQQQ